MLTVRVLVIPPSDVEVLKDEAKRQIKSLKRVVLTLEDIDSNAASEVAQQIVELGQKLDDFCAV